MKMNRIMTKPTLINRVLKYYQSHDRMFTDEEIKDVFRFKTSNRVSLIRYKLRERGHCFTMRIMKPETQKVEFGYYKHTPGEKGRMISVDPKLPPVDNSVLEEVLRNTWSNTTHGIMRSVLRFNQRGYWSVSEVSEVTDFAIGSFLRYHGLEFHRRLLTPCSYEYRVTGVHEKKPKKSDKHVDHSDIIRGVFS